MLKGVSAALVLVFLLRACQMAGTKTESPAMESGGMENAGKTMSEVHKISAEEAKNMMDTQSVTIVDVRTQEEYQAGHVPGAILVPNESIGDQAPEALPDKNAVLLVYCRSGHRSQIASEKLAALGYQNIYDFGGIIDWPYETVKE